jgi:DNA modification methylase
MTYQLHHGDCLSIMPLIERESVDAVITDSPYGYQFMGKSWDHGVPGEHFWREAYRCAKPGAHLLAFGGTRTFHRLAVAIEDAGWEIRDTVMWVYGQGFPKSRDVSKAIDKEAGAEREVIGKYDSRSSIDGIDRQSSGVYEKNITGEKTYGSIDITAPATPLAAQWHGFGTALKPAWEPIIVARKPLVGTVAENVTRYGTGAMNIDGCRIEIPTDEPDKGVFYYLKRNKEYPSSFDEDNTNVYGKYKQLAPKMTASGRWPANLIHDGSAEVLAGFPQANGATSNSHGSTAGQNVYGHYSKTKTLPGYGDTGSAARFFYCAKASKQDRDEGCEGLELRDNLKWASDDSGIGKYYPDGTERPQKDTHQRNHHPTVKPTSLMRYLCRLVTPPNGTILDPFMGSGSTGKAAMLEGFHFIGIDTEIEYVEIAARRIEHACEKVGIVVEQPMMFETKRETVDRPKQMMLL